MRKRNYALWFLIITILILTENSSYSQSQAELEQRRQQLQKEINTTQALLDRTGESKEAALTTLETLRKQLSSRRALLENYQQQIRLSEREIEGLRDSIDLMAEALQKETAAYFATLRKMYLWKKQQPTWLYYLSSTSANELFRKWIYLNQLEDWQEARKLDIAEKREALLAKKEKMQREQQLLERKLQQVKSTAAELDEDLNKEQQLLTQLRSKEQNLRVRLKEQVREREKLEAAIARVIEEARKKEKREKKTAFAETPEGKAMSGAFESNKGQLPWPVKKGVVTRRFGKQKHPTLSNLYVQNNGVDIATEPTSMVEVLFKGEVLGVVEVPGYQKMVIVQHGAYFTVYSRLSEVFVQKGDKVQTGSQIGQAYTDKETGSTLVHLEIWKDKTKLDPLNWLAGG